VVTSVTKDTLVIQDIFTENLFCGILLDMETGISVISFHDLANNSRGNVWMGAHPTPTRSQIAGAVGEMPISDCWCSWRDARFRMLVQYLS